MRPIADAHNDLLMELAFRAGEDNPFATHWLGQLRDGGVALQVCPVSAHFEQLPEAALRGALEQLVACRRAVRENPDAVALVRDRGELAAARESGLIALVLSMEGAEPLGYSIDLAEVFWELGVRMFGLTWNRRNPFADGLGEERAGGLSRIGRGLVDRLCELGAAIDLAHASERTFADTLDRAAGRAPILVSHAGCRAVHDTSRNLSDEQLRALADADGILGIIALPPAIDPQRPTVERVVDHVDHAVATIGVERVALGADFIRQVVLAGAARKPPDSLRPEGMGLDFSIDGLEGPAGFPLLVEALVRRGYTDGEVDAIVSDNLTAFLERSLPGVAA